MDFRFTEEQLKDRAEYFTVCKQLAEKRPAGFFGFHDILTSDEGWEFHKYCAGEFAKRGWLALGWPSEYGGHGTITNRVFFGEARGYYDVPGVDPFGIGMLAPTLLATAHEDIKRRFLPDIASGKVWWCELWSEPNAGSDLASLKSIAIRKGDVYVLNGQKTWTTGAHLADWGFGLFRTDPQSTRHRGLTFILIDMKTPNITIRPISYMHGGHICNEVYFDDVHVPVDNIVGKENDGWAVTQVLAGFERSGAGMVMGLRRMFEELVEYCNEFKSGEISLASNPIIRNRIAEKACELEAIQALVFRVIDLQSRNEMVLMDAAAVKIAASEFAESLVSLATEIMGPYGQVKFSRWAPSEGMWEKQCQECFAELISMGTNEIQRNIIAWYGLGLPRMR